jgi:hypothetical protein
MSFLKRICLTAVLLQLSGALCDSASALPPDEENATVQAIENLQSLVRRGRSHNATEAEKKAYAKALSDRTVDAVRLSDHFLRVTHKSTEERDETVNNALIYGGAELFAGSVLVRRPALKIDEHDKIVRRFLKKGWNLLKRGAGWALIAEGGLKIMLTCQDYDPTPLAIPGVLGYLGREANETLRETPENLQQMKRQLSGRVHEKN